MVPKSKNIHTFLFQTNKTMLVPPTDHSFETFGYSRRFYVLGWINLWAASLALPSGQGMPSSLVAADRIMVLGVSYCLGVVFLDSDRQYSWVYMKVKISELATDHEVFALFAPSSSSSTSNLPNKTFSVGISSTNVQISKSP